MTQWNDEQIGKALKAAFAPPAESAPHRDLWPQMVRRLEAPAPRVSWLEWAVVAIAALLAFLVPGAVPILFYFL
jgi:hypothetical protein